LAATAEEGMPLIPSTAIPADDGLTFEAGPAGVKLHPRHRRLGLKPDTDTLETCFPAGVAPLVTVRRTRHCTRLIVHG